MELHMQVDVRYINLSSSMKSCTKVSSPFWLIISLLEDNSPWKATSHSYTGAVGEGFI